MELLFRNASWVLSCRLLSCRATPPPPFPVTGTPEKRTEIRVEHEYECSTSNIIHNISKGAGRGPKVDKMESEREAQDERLAHSHEVGSFSGSVLLPSDDRSRLRKKSDRAHPDPDSDPDLDLDLVLHFCTSARL